MKKKTIIISSILLGLLTLMVILFGAVFCLRKINVNTLNLDAEQYLWMYSMDEQDRVEEDSDKNPIKLKITDKMIKDAAGLKKGTSIFAINKAKVIKNIEAKYPTLKVVQIKTVSVVQVQIVVRQRVGMYYMYVDTEFKNKGYYILDEELVILDKLPSDTPNVEDQFTQFDLTDYRIITRRPYYDKISTPEIQNIATNAFNAVCKTVKIKNDELSFDTDAAYVERGDFTKIISTMTLSKVNLPNDFNSSSITRYWLKIKTKSGIYLNILRPDKDLLTKINYSFTAISKLPEGNNTINCKLDENGSILLEYDNTVE